MEVRVKYLQVDKSTGIIYYRRRFPAELVGLIASRSPTGRGRRELKTSLGVREMNAPGAMASYFAAGKDYDEIVEPARKLASRNFDTLDEKLIRYLADTYLHNQLALDEAARWRHQEPDFPYPSRLHPESDYLENRELLAARNSDGLVRYWKEWGISYAHALGYVIDPSGFEVPSFCRALGEAACELWLKLDKRIDGEALGEEEVGADTPPVPMKPVTAPRAAPASIGELTLDMVAEKLMASRANPVNMPTVSAWRSALRFFGEAFGGPSLTEINRAMVTEWIELLAQRPARLPKQHRDVPLRELVSLYEEVADVPRLTKKTIRASHLASLSAIWNKGQEAGFVEDGKANPFRARKALVGSPQEEQGTEFEMSELQAIFSLPVFTADDRPRGGRGEACYWLPLILLWTGLRPEEAAQLLVADFSEDTETRRLLVDITAVGDHPAKGKRALKSMGRKFPVPSALIELGLPSYLAALREAGEQALFPRLTTKRGYLTPSIGPWWSGYLREQGVRLASTEGKQRRPLRDFRTTWATAARVSGVPEEAMSYLMGHTTAGKVQTRRYGSLSSHALTIDTIGYLKLDLSLIKPWDRGV